ncbi:MAG TPA: hypothetical protein VFT54_09385 [Acidimicrobiia bacterium]|nr:hypothetical protein [Acidimicrobiia bacterium]
MSTQKTDAVVPARAGRREWIGLSVLALACLLYVMDLTVRRRWSRIDTLMAYDGSVEFVRRRRGRRESPFL